MRLWRILPVLVSFGLVFVGAAPVSAGTITASGKITVTAIVAPEHYVIVDKSGAITEIISNTNQDVTPVVFAGSVKNGNEYPLTPEVFDQYKKLVRPGQSHIGILYKQPVASNATTSHLYSSQISSLVSVSRLLGGLGF